MPFEPDDKTGPTPGFVPDSTPTTSAPTPGFVPDKAPEAAKPTLGFTPDVQAQADSQPYNDPRYAAPTGSISEDARRIKEWATALPEHLTRGALHLYEGVTGMPVTQLALKTAMGDKNAVADWAAKEGGPNYVKENAKIPISYDPGRAPSGMQHTPPAATQEAPEMHTDISIPGTDISARQLLNLSADRTIGRAVRAGQRIGGKPLAQMTYFSTKAGADVIDEGQAANRLQAARNAQYAPVTGRAPSSMEHILPPAVDVTDILGSPEMHEHLSKTMLSVLGGEEFYSPDGSPLKKTADQQMQDQYGETGAKIVAGSAHLISQWPIMFFPGAEAKWAGEGADAVVKATLEAGPREMKAMLPAASKAALGGPVAQGLASGATQGVYMAASQKGQDYAEQMGYGTLLGGILGLAGGMWSRARLPRKLGAELATPKEYVPTLYGDVPMDAPRPAAVLLPNTMAALSKQLDDAIAKSASVRKPDAMGRGSIAVNKGKEGIKAMQQQEPVRGRQDTANNAQGTAVGRQPMGGAQQPEYGEFSFDFRKPGPGERVVPTFSYRTIDADGQLVLRDVSVEAGPGQAKQYKSKPVEVSKKGKVGARTVEPNASAHSTNITASYKDTPITSAEQMTRTMAGRNMNYAAESDEVSSLMKDLDFHDDVQAPDDIFAGTPDYMGPEVAGPFRENELTNGTPAERAAAALREKALRPANGAPTAIGRRGAKTDAHVMTVEPSGKVAVTPIVQTPPRPVWTAVFKPGDLIEATGGGPKLMVEGAAPDGKVLVRTGTGQILEMPAQEFHLLSDPLAGPKLRTELDKTYTRSGLNKAAPQDMGPRVKAIIQANEAVTVPDILRWAGRGPEAIGEAVGTLKNMEAQGLLKQTSPGVFSPTRAWKPKSPDIDPAAKGGQFVYYDTGVQPGSGALAGDHPTGSGLWGVLRGPDARTKGNWLIEVPDGTSVPDATAGFKAGGTSYVSVPEADVRTKWPVLMADKSRVDPGIDMYGWTKPMPPGFVQVLQGNIDDTEALSKAWAQANPPGVVGRSKAVSQKMAQAIIGAAHQSDPLLRASAGARLFAAPHVMRSEALAMANKLDAQLGGRGAPANQELTKILELHRAQGPAGTTAKTIDPAALQQWATKYPREAAASLRDIKALTALNDQYSAQLAARGVDKVAHLETQRAAGQIPEYLTTNYAAFQMPRREWAEFAHKNLTQEWRDVVEWMVQQYPGRDPAAITQDLDSILRLDNPLKGFEDKGYLKAEAKAKLLEKQDVPKPIRAILGEHKDASIKLAFSVAYKRQLVKGIESWDAIASQHGLWSPGVRPDMTLQVPDDPLFGNARNGYVNDNPSMRQLIEGRRLHNVGEGSSILRGMGWLGQKWKTGHTVYNQVAWVNNAVRNLKGVMLSGGFTGPEDMQGFRDAANMLADYARDPTIYGPNKLLIEAMDYDAVGPGLAGAELGAEQRKFQRKIFDYYKGVKSAGWSQAMEGVRDVALAVPEHIHQGYDAIDKIAKFGSYLNIRRKLIATGYSMDDAAAIAALRINKRFPNFTQTPDWVKRTVAGGGNFSLLAPYATSKIEDVRVNATLIKDIMETFTPGPKSPDHDPELPLRLLALTAGVGGAATLALHTRRMNGISDEEDLKQRATIPLKSQKYSHFLIGSLDYDPQGRRVFYPVDSYEDLLMSFQGNIMDAPTQRLLLNNLTGITGEDSFLGQGINAVDATMGGITGKDVDNTPRADQTGLLNTVQKYGPQFLPQAPFVINKAMNQQAPSGRLVNGEPWTPDQALVRELGGQSPIPVGPQTRKQTMMETATNVKARAKDVGAAAMDAALQGVSGDRQKYMIQSNIREMKKSINVPRPLKPSGGSK